MEELRGSNEESESLGTASGGQATPPKLPCNDQARKASLVTRTEMARTEPKKRVRGEEGEAGKEKPAASSGATTMDGSTSASQPAAAAAAGHTRNSTDALVNSSSSASSVTQERAFKQSKGNSAASPSSGAASASRAAAAAAASSSSSHPPQLQPPPSSFFHPVHAMLEEVLPLAQSLIALRRSAIKLIFAIKIVQLQEARKELQQLQAQVIGEPQLQQEMQPRVKQLQGYVQANEKWLARAEAEKQEEQKILQSLRDQLARAPGELTIALAQNIHRCRWARLGLLSNQIPLELRMQLGCWATRACLLLEQLASSLTAEEIRLHPQLTSSCARLGLLSSVQSMLQLSGGECVIETERGDSYLSVLAADPLRHPINLMPLLHFIRYGLNPTLARKEFPRPALQLAREHVQSRPLTSEAAKDQLQAEMDESGCGSNGAPHDFTMDYVTLQTAATWPEEEQRRQEQHARFMHALLSAWRAHSSAVRALLLDAAPDRLIPDLVNICADYLDLEPADREKRQ